MTALESRAILTSRETHGMTTVEQNKILCVRIDRIGDLVLTLPADSLTNASEVTWMVNKNMGFICEFANPRRTFVEAEREFSFKRFLSLTSWLKNEKFSHIIFFHAPWWMSCAAWVAGIPKRAGRKSQWHSFLFLNFGFRQSRLAGEKSELDYNSDLMQKSLELFKLPSGGKSLSLKLQSADQSHLERYDLKPKKYLVVHAGMSGSARNWPVAHYASLVFRMSRQTQVVLTGTPSDGVWLNPLRNELKKYGEIEKLLWLDGKLSTSELLTVLHYASAVVAPSTGVAHLSAALGVRTIGIYSPVKSQNVIRWGPKGEAVQTLTPQVDCPGVKNCIGPTCPKYDCMELVTVESVVSKL